MTKKQKPTKLSNMFDKKCALKEKMMRIGTDDDDTLKKELDEIEFEITNEISMENRNKVIETFKVISETDGTTNVNGIWGLNKDFS